MKKVIATICVLAGSTLALGACTVEDRTVDSGPGFANERTAGDGAARVDVETDRRVVRRERTFTRAQSK